MNHTLNPLIPKFLAIAALAVFFFAFVPSVPAQDKVRIKIAIVR